MYAELSCNGIEVRIKSRTITKLKDVETILRDLYEAADKDMEKAQRGIVYIDEIDKISRKGESASLSTDPGHEALQQGLLKMLEGCEVEVPEKGQRFHPEASTIKINSKDILFIVGGSFEGIEKIIAKRQQKSSSAIGFNGKIQRDTSKQFNEFILDVKTEDLKKFGMLPEFLGRLPVIAPLQELDEAALVKILTEPKNSLVKQYTELFKEDGIELEITEDALNEIAHRAIERRTGARSLRGILEEILSPIMFKAPDEDYIKIVVGYDKNEKKITEKYINEKEAQAV